MAADRQEHTGMTPRQNTLKAALETGERTRGCFLTLPSPDVAEVLAHAGFDVLLIDHEHGTGSIGDAVAQMRAMGGTGTSSMVRIPSHDAAYIKRVLDAGADCLLCPMVESRSEAEAIVQACRFPPDGARSAGGGTRASRYGRDAGYHSDAARSLLVAVQIESARGVANIEDIAAVPGVDMLLIGPRDLSASIGRLNRFDDPELLSLVADAERRILASGKYLASVIYPGSTARAMFDRGYHMLVTGSDVAILTQGARSLLAT